MKISTESHDLSHDFSPIVQIVCEGNLQKRFEIGIGKDIALIGLKGESTTRGYAIIDNCNC